MTPHELRVKVAEELGWTFCRERDTGAAYWVSPDNKVAELPNFGAPDWSATGAVLDEIERRGCGLWLFRANPPETLVCVEPSRTTPSVHRINPCIHRAICLAFLEAHTHARAKEPTRG